MKIIGISFALLSGLSSALAFSPLAPRHQQQQTRLFSTVDDAPSDIEELTLTDAKNKVMAVAKKLKDEHGIQLIAKGPKKELKEAVEELEALASMDTLADTSTFMGDWTLVISTATNREGVDTSRLENLPSYLLDPISKIRSSILETSNKYLVVQQKIKSTNDDGVIDRIDHTLELEPPAQLRDVLDNLPEQLMNVNINPLAVSKSKLILVHKASIEEEGPPLKTKLSLQSIVLNVAGTSRVLDPNGKDVAGINIPHLGDFMNTADFETTYLDDDIRISRGKLGFVEQLRVFCRTEPPTTKVKISEEVSSEEEIVDIESAIADVDVGSIADPGNDDAPSDVESDDLTP